MIYRYHLDFKNEEVLKIPPENNIRGIIPVVEDTKLELSPLLSIVSQWYPIGDTEVRYFSDAAFSKLNNDVEWGLEVKDVLMLFWSKEREEISYSKGKKYRPDRLRFWICHTFLPLSLERRGIYHVLHVGSVEIAGKPVLFSAPSYGGKSTMTDYFIQQGHTMLSDDALGIEKVGDAYHAIASYPFHRPYRKAEDLGYPVENFSTESKPLSAVYMLNKSETEDEITIRKIKGIEKFKAFHFSSFVMFNFIKEERFRFFADMAEKVPVYEITYPHNLERLPEVYEKIIQWQIEMTDVRVP